MASDPQVDLIFSHFTPRYVATGVDPNDLQRLKARIDRWSDWCRLWCEEGARHEALAQEAVAQRRWLTGGEAYLRAAIYYHYAKHLFGEDPEQFRDAHERMLRCYCVANCGPFEFGPVLPQLPKVSQELFRIRSHAADMSQAQAIADRLSLADCAHQIKCPLLVVFGAGDRIVPPSEGEKLAKAAAGPTDFVVYEEGNHVCFNISYKFRPLTADWTVEHL